MRWESGQYIVFSKLKCSSSPGPRAREIDPASSGEAYTYLVDKFWVIKETLADGRVVVLTRGGKEHILDPDGGSCRHPSLWERLRYRQRLNDLDSVLKKVA